MQGEISMKYIKIKPFEDTNLVKTAVTTNENTNWAQGNEAALENYKALGAEFGITPAQMVRTWQVHSAGVRTVTKEQGGDFILNDITAPETDGLITNERGLMLCTLQADCVPVFLLDPVKKVIGMIHSGWKGTNKKIAANAVRLMKEKYGTDPADVLAAMGPCICGRDYEVSADLKEAFLQNYPEDAVEDFFEPKDNGKYYLYLDRAIRFALKEAGLKGENIYDPEYCTVHSGLFPSYRASGGTNERMLTGIMLV